MKKFILSTGIVTSLLVFSVSCSSTKESSTSENNTTTDVVEDNSDTSEDSSEENTDIVNENDPIDIGLMASIDALPILYADEMGLFEENGVLVNLETFFSAKDRDIAYLGGELDGLIADLIGVSTLYAAEKPVTIITTTTAEFGLAVTPDSGITSIEDMKGKEILYSKNSVIDYSIDKILETAGLTEEDVVKTVVPALPLRAEMLLKNESDSALLPDPFMTVAKVGGSNIIVKTSDLGLDIITLNLDTEYLENNNAVVEPLLSAYDQAVEILNAMSDEEFNDYIFNKFQYDEALRGEIVRMEYRVSTLPSEEQFYDAFNWSVDREIIDEVVPYETVNYIK